MNWKLIIGLSMFGLAMGLGTCYFIGPKLEPICWLVIFLVCARQVAKYAEDKYFLHGLLISLFNCIWITGIHIMLSADYLARHSDEAHNYAKMNAQMGMTVTQAMLVMGPVIGIASGLVLGLFCFIASKFFPEG